MLPWLSLCTLTERRTHSLARVCTHKQTDGRTDAHTNTLTQTDSLAHSLARLLASSLTQLPANRLLWFTRFILATIVYIITTTTTNHHQHHHHQQTNNNNYLDSSNTDTTAVLVVTNHHHINHSINRTRQKQLKTFLQSLLSSIHINFNNPTKELSNSVSHSQSLTPSTHNLIQTDTNWNGRTSPSGRRADKRTGCWRPTGTTTRHSAEGQVLDGQLFEEERTQA